MFSLHEHWVIRTFVPLLKLLEIQNIPNPPVSTVINLADHDEFIHKGMENCIISIRQKKFSKNIGGLLITSHKKIKMDDTSNIINSFRLNIIINSHLYMKTSPKGKSRKKLTAIHEFTHAVAALTAISKIRSDEIIDKFKKKLDEKTHVLDLQELSHLAWVGISGTEPKVNDLYKVCRVLATTMEWLIDGDAGTEYVCKLVRNDPKAIQVPDCIYPIVECLLVMNDRDLSGILAQVQTLARDKK